MRRFEIDAQTGAHRRVFGIDPLIPGAVHLALLLDVGDIDDRREFRLRLTRKGATLYEELIPRLLRKEQEILSSLSAQERRDFARLLGKLEESLDLVQTSEEADAKEAY